MQTADFDYDLPPELIAQHPTERRDASRLLVVYRLAKRLAHRQFTDLAEYLEAGDLLVVNNSRVIPARLRGQKDGDGARVEILLIEQLAPGQWWSMLRPGKRIHKGTRIQLHDLEGRPTEHWVTATDKSETGKYLLQLPESPGVFEILAEIGETPLPPYIERAPVDTRVDCDRYQTVFAKEEGSVAAPTAGLHFTDPFLDNLKTRGVGLAEVTLHVGPGTFQPVECDAIEDHPMHEEWFEISAETTEAIHQAKQAGRRVIAVGTTSMRVLESAADENGSVEPQQNRTDIFIYPPHTFRIVDALLTNFHLPKSTLLMLVSAFADPDGTAGREQVMRAYNEAIENRYRFFSYGDAMFLHR